MSVVPTTPSPRSVAPVVHRGELLGWYPMAYLGANPQFVAIQIQTQAPAGVVVGRSTTIDITPAPLGAPVWVSIEPARLTAHSRDGSGTIRISTDGCPPTAACDRRPLYVLTGSPIPPAPPGGVVTRNGIQLRIDTGGVEPGRYDLTLPIRYPSNNAHPALLDTTDTLHVRIDIAAQGPPSLTCTPADLRRPPAIAPPAHALTDTIALEGGSTRLDPAPRDVRPRVSPARARGLLLPMGGRRGGGAATLVLASLSEMQGHRTLPIIKRPGGQLLPVGKVALSPHNVLAWVLYTQHVATPDAEVSRPAPLRGVSDTTPPDACFFVDAVSSINATTGDDMDSSGGSAAADIIRF